ncbi:WD-repeat [Fusarium beomiforme]|uniref:Mitochondrial division protein 1 n=1 Tax=Fusarium beomiforme TaxID=44412 RepID=A0A9P5DW32_9HYPO|nr:WD-repeat [Fusarium beomiforme]
MLLSHFLKNVMDEWEIEGPQQKVDGIYLKVLRFPDIESWHEKLRVPFYSGISRLIGFIVVLFQPASVETIAQLLSAGREDLDDLLAQLHPIINVPEDPDVPITLIHLSFRDFILNEKRSELLPFSVKEVAMHREIFHRCLEIMNSELRQNICCLSLPGILVSDVISSHIEAHVLNFECLGEAGLEDGGLVHIFLSEKLLYWLEPMAFMGEASSIILIIIRLESLIDLSEKPGLSSLIHDAKKRFVQTNRWILDNAPLQLYCSALLFCPSKSRVRFYYQHLIPEWILKRPETQERWGSELYSLEGHSGWVNTAAFSPTEHLIASVGSGNTTRVWDCVTGSELYRFQDPDPLCICFSMDGLKLASGRLDGTICIRDLRKGTDISVSGPSPMLQISFSPISSNILASLFEDHKLRIWNLTDGQQRQFHHASEPRQSEEFVFSPDGQFVAVYCLTDDDESNLIGLFNVEMAEPAKQFRLSKKVDTMAFSIDSRILAVRVYDMIYFWDITLPDPKLARSYKVAWSNHSPFLFLPSDEKLSLHQDCSAIIEVRDALTGDSMGKFLKDFGWGFSRDGAFTAIVRRDHPVIQLFSHTFDPLLFIRAERVPSKVEFLSNDSVALSYGGQMVAKRWIVDDGSMQPLQNPVIAIKYSPDRDFLLLQLNKGEEFQLWDKALMHCQATFDHMADVAFLPHTNQLLSLSLSGELRILFWDAESRTLKTIWSVISFFEEGLERTTCWNEFTLHPSPRGHEVVMIAPLPEEGLSWQLWNLVRKKRVKGAPVILKEEIIFSPESEFFGVQCDQSGNRTHLFHVSTGEEVDNCDLRNYTSLTFRPTDRIFAVASENTIAIWKGLPWIKTFMLEMPQGQLVKHLALSATSKLAAISKSELDGDPTIDVWDIFTKQKIGSQDFKLFGSLLYLSFSTDENFFQTNKGRLPVPIPQEYKTGPEKQWQCMQNCLYVLDEWVLQGKERLIWLPPAYRPEVGGSVDIRGGMIALANRGNLARI